MLYSFIHIEFWLDEIWAAIKHEMVSLEEEKTAWNEIRREGRDIATQHLERNVVPACQCT